jgi:hypothetical protein
VCVCATDTDAAYNWWTLWRGREQVSATHYCNCCKTARFWHKQISSLLPTWVSAQVWQQLWNLLQGPHMRDFHAVK